MTKSLKKVRIPKSNWIKDNIFKSRDQIDEFRLKFSLGIKFELSDIYTYIVFLDFGKSGFTLHLKDQVHYVSWREYDVIIKEFARK